MADGSGVFDAACNGRMGKQADAEPFVAIGNPAVEAGMTAVQILDDDGAFRDDHAVVEQQRKLAEGRKRGECGPVLLDRSELERGRVGVERGQRLPGVAAERMAVEG